MNSDEARLHGKTIVLTGAYGELGRETSKLLMSQGARVILTGRSIEKLEAWALELKRTNPNSEGSVDCVRLDGSSYESSTEAAHEIYSRYGEVSALINNAGSAGPKCRISELPLNPQGEGSLSETFNSLLATTWYTTLAFKEYLCEGASVVNISTVFSKTEYFGRAPYVIPKAALNCLSQLMSEQLGAEGKKIRVNTILPGPIASDRIDSAFAAMDTLMRAEPGTTKQQVLGDMCLKDLGSQGGFLSKAEVASAISFLVSDESSGLTSQEIEVTHGLRVPEDSGRVLSSHPAGQGHSFHGRTVVIFSRGQGIEAIDVASRLRNLGAEVTLATESEEELKQVQEAFEQDNSVFGFEFDVFSAQSWMQLNERVSQSAKSPSIAAIVMTPSRGAADRACEATPEAVAQLINDRLVVSALIARGLDQLFIDFDSESQPHHSVVFVSPQESDCSKDYLKIEAAAHEALFRVWRGEARAEVKAELRHSVPSLKQLLRYENSTKYGDLSWEWLKALCDGSDMGEALSFRLQGAPSTNTSLSDYSDEKAFENRNLHSGRVALVTGGSEGIGGAITTQLLLSGARVAVAERNTEKLQRAWNRLVKELRGRGFSDPESRLYLIPNTDVSIPTALAPVVGKVIEKFGRLDFIINNAGLVGAEKMVVDMNEDKWRQTLQGNLISNYQLIHSAMPFMRAQGFGHVINMSSYFGGYRHGSVPYTNRADYAVSKAGQQALTESMASILGPEIQVNCVAPGPVDGARLNGAYGSPGLYLRRAKLTYENRRLNRVYAASVEALKAGASKDHLVKTLLCNHMEEMAADPNCPVSIKRLCKVFSKKKEELGSASDYLLTPELCAEVFERLKSAGWLDSHFEVARELEKFDEPKEAYLSESYLREGSIKIRQEMLDSFALRRMPADSDLAREVVRVLAHRTTTGEIFHPTCGFRYNGSRLAQAFRSDGLPISSYGSEAFEDQLHKRIENKRIYVFANVWPEEVAKLVARILGNSAPENSPYVTLVARDEDFSAKVLAELEKQGKAHLEVELLSGRSVGQVFEHLRNVSGSPAAVFSLPMGPVLSSGLAPGEWPSVEDYQEMVEQNLTNHFLVSQKASLVDDCKCVFVSSLSDKASGALEQSLVETVRDSLRSFTIAVGREAAALSHHAEFFQIDGTAANDEFFRTLLFMVAAEMKLNEASVEKTQAA